MRLEEAVAYVQAQAVAAQIEMHGMISLNKTREMNGHAMAYGEDEFNALNERYCISHNAVIGLFKGSQ